MPARAPLEPPAGGDGNPYREPLFDHLGIRLTGWQPGHAEFALDLAGHHLNYAGSLHGGVIATLLDVACGYCGLRSVSDRAAGLAATITLTVSYHAPVATGGLVASGRVTGRGRSVFFSTGEVRTLDGALVATAQGAYKLAPSVAAG